MFFPLSLSDLSLWLAVTAIILLITSELLYSSPGYSAKVAIDREILRVAAIGCGLGFSSHCRSDRYEHYIIFEIYINYSICARQFFQSIIKLRLAFTYC